MVYSKGNVILCFVKLAILLSTYLNIYLGDLGFLYAY